MSVSFEHILLVIVSVALATLVAQLSQPNAEQVFSVFGTLIFRFSQTHKSH